MGLLGLATGLGLHHKMCTVLCLEYSIADAVVTSRASLNKRSCGRQRGLVPVLPCCCVLGILMYVSIWRCWQHHGSSRVSAALQAGGILKRFW
jgi:hypothetical protein